MNTEKITSVHNARVKAWNALHTKKGRDEAHLFLVEGEHLVEEALKENILKTLIIDRECPFDFDHIIEVTPEIMKKISQNVSAVHMIGVCEIKEKKVGDADRVILLDGVQDPGNLGTMIRTAVSFGFDAVYCSNDTCDLYNDKVIRSTQGALFHIPVIRKDLSGLITALRNDGFRIVATTLEHSKTMSEIPNEGRLAFIFGNEGNGVSKAIQQASDERLRIEMEGFESLNVAVAAGIIMYHYQRNL
jgi:TrmH family RNA methyltransferase